MIIEDFYEYIIALCFILLVIIFIVRYCLTQYKKNLISFIQLNSNITLLSTKDKIISINKVGLDFFGYGSLEELTNEHISISDFFIEAENCINKHTYGKKWLETLSKAPKDNHIVNIIGEMDIISQFFHIKVSKMRYNDTYLISLNNISNLVREKEEIRTIADHDALTHIYNRVKFNSMFTQIIDTSLRYDENFSIILFDIDHFKNVNDTYGHNVGDRVLIELVSLVKIGLRDKDVFARWGGEEFVILCKRTSSRQAEQLATRLRKDIEHYIFEVVKKLTCSFGVSQFHVEDSKNDLFQRVDEALYEAKDRGRNQVVIK
jgi:diguanylate cyclase (GGDEF)-like protein